MPPASRVKMNPGSTSNRKGAFGLTAQALFTGSSALKAVSVAGSGPTQRSPPPRCSTKPSRAASVAGGSSGMARVSSSTASKRLSSAGWRGNPGSCASSGRPVL